LRYRKLDANGDMIFGGNSNDFYTDADAVGQAVYTSLKLLQGEWWEDTSQGLPLFQNILGLSGSPNHIHAVDMLIQEVILDVQGVVQITSFSSSYVDRKYQITNMMVESQFGNVA